MAKSTPRIVIAPPPPAPATVGAGPSPLGVPAGYTVDSTTSTTFERGGPRLGAVTSTVGPRYFDGDEWTPAALSPEKIVMLQKQMVTAGLIGPKTKFRIGVWDDATRGAYKGLLSFANAAGVDYREGLKRYGASAAIDPTGGDGTDRAPLTIKKTNPIDLIRIADVTARTELGRKLRPAEAAAMSAAFQAGEVAEQTTDYNQAATGGTSVAGPGAQAFMADRIRKQYGVEAGAHDLSNQGNQFLQILKEVGG